MTFNNETWQQYVNWLCACAGYPDLSTDEERKLKERDRISHYLDMSFSK